MIFMREDRDGERGNKFTGEDGGKRMMVMLPGKLRGGGG